MIRPCTALLLTLALATTPALAQQEISKVNGSITADAGQTYGDLDTVNGSIRIGDGVPDHVLWRVEAPRRAQPVEVGVGRLHGAFRA